MIWGTSGFFERGALLGLSGLRGVFLITLGATFFYSCFCGLVSAFFSTGDFFSLGDGLVGTTAFVYLAG
jgi:hypothetical protein